MPFDISNLRQRVLSAAVIAPLTVFAVYYGGWVYVLITCIVAALGAVEWVRLCKLISQTAKQRAAWSAFGIPYLAGFAMAMIFLRDGPKGMEIVAFLFAAVWGTDIGAFAAGRLIGGPKLAPRFSPNKTLAGLLGGMGLAALSGYGVSCLFGAAQPQISIGIAAVMAVVSQLGDLFESYVKRRAGVKESGDLIPGHGGVLDRIDGLIFAAIFLALFQFIMG
jgi:phosphatidate cytidylyltransferase